MKPANAAPGRVVVPGPDHLERVLELFRVVSAAGKIVAEAQHAALAIAEGCTWVTRDGQRVTRSHS